MLNLKKNIMPSKVKISTASAKTTQAQNLRPIAWQMDPVRCPVIASYDLKSKIGVQISLVMLEYDKKCTQAKAEMIEELIKLLKQPKKLNL